jgi:hypothetical protein
MGHPYAPADLELPGFVPLQLLQGQILVTYIGTSLFVLLAVWLISGTHTLPSSCINLLLLVSPLPQRGFTPSLLELKFQCPKLQSCPVLSLVLPEISTWNFLEM